MLWLRVTQRGWWYVYREWPSHGHAKAYVPGVGDPGEWALPGQPSDGVRGPAQTAFGFGLDRYKQEILRLEGHPEAGESVELTQNSQTWWRKAKRHPILKKHVAANDQTEGEKEQAGPEEITERWMDCRYANTPSITREGRTTLLDQMDDIGMTFLSAPTEAKILDNETGAIHLINDMLDYDDEVPRGTFSPRLARTNHPKLYISRNCPNLIYALREWTGKDGNKGACKDPLDCLRYAVLAELDYLDTSTRFAGGSY
jgi:hypothetical protein